MKKKVKREALKKAVQELAKAGLIVKEKPHNGIGWRFVYPPKP